MIVWLNGSLTPIERARIDPRDRGFLLADGLFETMLVERGRLFRPKAHLERLRRGAAFLGIPFDHDDDSVSRTLIQTVAANGLEDGRAAVRITLTRGGGPRGLLPPSAPKPTLMIAVAPAHRADSPAHAIIGSLRRNEHSPLAAVKSLSYLDNVLARREAAERGADEALLLNTAGRLTEASAANLFVVAGGKLLTPALDEGVLPGITRAVVLELAAQIGIVVSECPLPCERLWDAEETFLTNSLIGLRPLVAVDGHTIGGSRPGSTTRRLQVAYAKARSAG